jgi:hypothetical protein
MQLAERMTRRQASTILSSISIVFWGQASPAAFLPSQQVLAEEVTGLER